MQETDKESHIVRAVSTALIIVFAVLPYLIFKKVMLTGQHDFYDQISLGAVLVGMASAIITIATSHMDRQYDRVMLDVDILFKDLTSPGEWRRWPFVPRSKTKKLIYGPVHQITLKNPIIEFDLGTHTVEVYVPTCLQDFFDLPTFSTFLKILLDDKKFYSYVQRKNISGLMDPTILKKDTKGWMIWDCMHDIWRTIVLYRLEELVVRFFAVFTGSSVILSFLFSQIAILGK